MATVAKEHRITLFPKQGEFVYAEQPFCAFIGGVGSGKSEAGAVKAIRYMTEYPGSLGMVTAPTFPMLRDATLRSFKKVLPEGSYEFKEADMRLVMHNGSEALFRSTDDPDRLRGPNLAWAYMDEAAQSKADSFKILQGRLRQPGFPHQLWITTTPFGFNWVYQEFAMQERDDYLLTTVSSRDNPYLTPDFVKRLEESYADDFALQEIEGQFVIVGGRVFFNQAALKEMLGRTFEPIERRSGLVNIWKRPYTTGKYVAGADVAWGERGAYSCTVIMDRDSGEIVAEMHGRPTLDEGAMQTVNLCKEYNNAFLGVENNGEGKTVLDRIVDLGYRNIYYQDWDARKPEKPGWHTNRSTRDPMLADLESVVREGRVKVYCKDAVQEMMSAIRDDKGHPMASEGAYFDHVMALAICWQMRPFRSSSVASDRPIAMPRF